jgi:putrescine aminotransferase
MEMKLCMDSNERSSIYARYVSNPYITFLNRMELLIDVDSAEGAIVTSKQGKKYIDCIAGYGNCVVGHNPRQVIEAVVSELRSPRPFNLPFVHEVQSRLAEKLAKETPGDLECSFVVNSGSEAVETALKLARLATGKPGVICTSGSWHGFTFGCLSVSEQSMCRQFRPMLGGVTCVPYGDSSAAEAAIDGQTGCVIVEPIQSENGAVVPPDGYLKSLQEVCEKRGVLLVFDEVKTGIAKTGKMFACEYDLAVPDILVCGKALGGGVMPVGAIVSRRRIWGKFGLSFPMSSSSGAGNAPACAAALATLEMVRKENLCECAERQGNRLMNSLRAIAETVPDKIIALSGRGLLIGVTFPSLKFASAMVSTCARNGVLAMTAFCDRTKILIEPPACISDDQVETVVRVFGEAVKSCVLE